MEREVLESVCTGSLYLSAVPAPSLPSCPLIGYSHLSVKLLYSMRDNFKYELFMFLYH